MATGLKYKNENKTKSKGKTKTKPEGTIQQLSFSHSLPVSLSRSSHLMSAWDKTRGGHRAWLPRSPPMTPGNDWARGEMLFQQLPPVKQHWPQLLTTNNKPAGQFSEMLMTYLYRGTCFLSKKKKRLDSDSHLLLSPTILLFFLAGKKESKLLKKAQSL